MFDFDGLPSDKDEGEAKTRSPVGPTFTVGIDDSTPLDLTAARACVKRLGNAGAMSLLGKLLRLHHPQEYSSYVEFCYNPQAEIETETPQTGQSIAEDSDASWSLKEEGQGQKLKDDKEDIVGGGPQKQEMASHAEQDKKDNKNALGTELEIQEPESCTDQQGDAEVAESTPPSREAVEEPIAESAPDENQPKEIILLDRASARLTRWDNDEEPDSGDEAISTLSTIGRSLSLFTRAVGIGFTMALSSDPTAAGKQIAAMCRSQGGIYIKAAQMVSSMSFAFPQEVLAEFESLQDSADTQDWSEIEERVETNTPGGIDYMYKSFEHEAAHAASIAQVHMARRSNGDKVAVKVLRRGMDKTFNTDVDNYLALLGGYEKATGIQVKWMQEWVMKELKKEIDFRHEATLHEEAADWVKQHPKFHGELCLPEIHSELCTKRILVMEYVDGCKITLAPQHFPDWDRERDVPKLFATLESWLAMQVFLTGKFHGDPHAGNVMLRRKQGSVTRGETPFELVVLDHGGYYQLSLEARQLYAELWLMMDKPRDEAHRLKRKARLAEILRGWGIQHAVRFVLEQMLGGHMGTVDPTSSVKENGEARMHKYNLMVQNGKEYGPDMFSDTSKMPPELMKAQGSGSFLASIWRSLAGKMTGWNAPERRREIMMHWAGQCPGVRRPP